MSKPLHEREVGTLWKVPVSLQWLSQDVANEMPLCPRTMTFASYLWGQQNGGPKGPLSGKGPFLCALGERIELKFRFWGKLRGRPGD